MSLPGMLSAANKKRATFTKKPDEIKNKVFKEQSICSVLQSRFLGDGGVGKLLVYQ